MGLHYTILICAVIELLYLGQAFAQSNDTQDNAKLSYQAAGNATTDSDASLNGSSTDLGRGKPEKYPDITICDNAYGFDLEFDICDKAFAKLPEGDQFARYVTQKSYPLSSELKVPFYYTDLEEGSEEEPKCTITIDLAGRSLKNNYVNIRHNTLRNLVSRVNTSCLGLNFGRAGFATYHMEQTIDGISKFEEEPAGFNAPVFLTAQISQKGSRARAGNTDPRINKRIRDELTNRIRSRYQEKYDKQKLMVLVNSLLETSRKMRVRGDQSWWDTRHVTQSIPTNVDYQCDARRGRPIARDCEDLSFFFIGDKSILVEPRKRYYKSVWSCEIYITTQERHKVAMDVLRATMDVMINTCLDGPGAPGVGGTAVALPLMLNGTTNSTVNSDSGPYAVERRQAVPNVDPHPWVLPPTYVLDMRINPHPGNNQQCNPVYDTAGNLTDWCVEDIDDSGSEVTNSTLPIASNPPSPVSSDSVPSSGILESGGQFSVRPALPSQSEESVLTSRDKVIREARLVR